MKKPKNTSGIYAYLNARGVLTSGSDEDIQNAKHEYWKVYKAAWRKQQRHKGKEFTIALSGDEMVVFQRAAQKHKRSVTHFIKESAKAYISKCYLVPDALAVATVQQLLAMNYNLLKKMFDENLLPFDVGRLLLKHMETLEKDVMQKLIDPKEIKPPM